MSSLCGIKRKLTSSFQDFSYSSKRTRHPPDHTDNVCSSDLKVKVKTVQTGITNHENLSASGDFRPWVELLASEMTSATSMEIAKARAITVLESLQKSIIEDVCQNQGSRMKQQIIDENSNMKQQLKALTNENSVLKRAVVIQHQRQKDKEGMNLEMQHVISKYQQQVRTLELNNYALAMQLRQAQPGSNPMLGGFNPDIF